MIADGIEPLGAIRDDMRAARNTIRIVQALRPEMDDEELQREADSLKNYLPFNQSTADDGVLLPEEAEEIKRREGE